MLFIHKIYGSKIGCGTKKWKNLNNLIPIYNYNELTKPNKNNGIRLKN